MCGESSSSSMDSLQNMPMGTESELLRIEGAQHYLLDGTESVRIGTGDFSLIMIIQANTGLAALVAQVAEFQWPIGKDGPVLKIANLRYTFALPGLVYGVILPDNTTQEHVQKFESCLRQFCTFEICPEIAKAAGVSDLRLWASVGRHVDGAAEGARYWTAVADDVEGYSATLVRQMQSGSKVAANSILKGGEWATWGVKQGGSYVQNIAGRGVGDEMSPRMRKRVDQARRMSAVAKLLSRTVLKGTISASSHVANFLGTAIGEAPAVRAFMSSDARRAGFVASVDAFAQVVEAVETAGKSLALATGSVGTEIVQHKFGEQAGQAAQDGMGAMGNMIDSMWTLNKVGLYMLWRATTASTALNYGFRSGGTSRSISGSSSDVTSQSPQAMASSSASISTKSVNPMLQPSSQSIGPMSVTTSMCQNNVPRTAQLFPKSSDNATGQFYSPHMYLRHPQTTQMAPPTGYAGHYQTPQHCSTSFQQYTRPGIPPTMQLLFPQGTEPSKSQ